MSTVKQIESALERLPLEDLQSVRDWLDDFIEDRMEVSDEFTAKVHRAQQEIADGVYSRARKTKLEKELADVLRGPCSKIPVTEIILASRR